MHISERAQVIMIWWTLVFTTIFGLVLYWLLKMMPPPAATWTELQVANFYAVNGFKIKLGAMITSWTSAFGVPFGVVIALQMARLEKGVPAWSILAFAGGILMTMFLVFPPIMWGVAAFTTTRAPEVTTLMHELALLTLTTTDQYFIFLMIPLGIVCLTRQHDELSAFPRWFGYFTLWIAAAFEVGALAFMFKSGPFAWNGLLVFWMPLVLYGLWILVTCIMMLKALKRQQAALLQHDALAL